MSDLFIKGTAFGFDYKTWIEDKKLLSSLLLSVLDTWFRTIYNAQGIIVSEISKEQEREYGRIKNAILGFEGDLHNLTVNYHLLTSLVKNDNIDKGIKSLYISLLIENYIMNIRSLYDFCSFFPRIIMSIENVKKYSNRKYSDSLNTFIKYCDSEELQELPINMRNFIKGSSNKLEDIKTIRDSIIHKGKESIVEFKDNDIFFRIPVKAPYGVENALPDILHLGNSDYPLTNYLKELTISLFDFMENLGMLLYGELQKTGKLSFRFNGFSWNLY